MPKDWPLASKQNPCPVCGGSDWLCRFGDMKILCMREPSAHSSKDGGWYHDYDGANKPVARDTQPVKYVPIVKIECAQYAKELWHQTSPMQIQELSLALGVSVNSLDTLQACYSARDKAYAFPMRDADDNIIGIRLRNDKGEKWAVKGSRQGLFVPRCNIPKLVYLCEGPTSTAAALTLGFYAIGRPNCNSGDDLVKATLKRLGIYRAVIVADNDEKEKWKCLECGMMEDNPLKCAIPFVCDDCNMELKMFKLTPGLTGALKLKKYLGISSVIWMPEQKDIRKFLNDGGTKAMIESQIKGMIWTKK